MAFDLINQNLSDNSTQELKTAGAEETAFGESRHIIRILCCDGGGVRGAASAGFLEELELALQKEHRNDNLKLNDVFDFIAGNSTGSIIAGLVATGQTAGQISDLYKNLAAKAFPSPSRSPFFWFITMLVNPLLAVICGCIVFGVATLIPWLAEQFPVVGDRLPELPPIQFVSVCLSVSLVTILAFLLLWKLGVMPHQWWLAKFGNGGLQASLQSAFGTHTLNDIAALTLQTDPPFKRTLPSCVLMIPSINLYSREVVVYKSPHEGSPTPMHQGAELWKAVLQSTAAQTYLPIVIESETNYFTDGGLWANNPALVVITEALKYAEEKQWGDVSIRMISVGTGAPSTTPVPLPMFRSGSLPFWGGHILPCMFDAQGRGISYCAGELLSSARHAFRRVDFELGRKLAQVDNSSTQNMHDLRAAGLASARLFNHRGYVATTTGTAEVVKSVVEALA